MANMRRRAVTGSAGPDFFPEESVSSVADAILLTVLAEIETFAEIPEELFVAPPRYVEQMASLGVPYRPRAWFGGSLPPRLRKVCSRAVDRLEWSGLIERITEPKRDRVTHLRPTQAGLRAALEIAATSADRRAINEALRRTDWGGELSPDALARARSPPGPAGTFAD